MTSVNGARFAVQKVIVREIGSRSLRRIVGDNAEAQARARAEAHCGIIYRMVDNTTGEKFEFTGRLSDFEPESLQRLLIPDARGIAFVAPPVLEEATRIVNGLFEQHPEILANTERFTHYEDPPVNFKGLKFTCNPTDVMFFVVLKSGQPLPRIEDCFYPHGQFVISPNAQVLHYCTEEFDGAKGIMGVDGKFAIFRPDWGVDRELVTAERMCLPLLPREFLFNTRVQTALKNRRVWPTTFEEGSLYIRAFMFDYGEILGVDVTGTVIYAVIAHPAGAYYHPGQSPVEAPISLWASDVYHRAAPGMTGYTKAGPNYAGTIKPKHVAKSMGHDEVLYLDPTNQLVNEIGSANCIGIERLSSGKFRLITPEYSSDPAIGTILNGGTRDSILTLARDRWGWEVYEGPVPIERLLKCTCIIATGTAAVISTVGCVEFKGRMWQYTDFEPAAILYDGLTGIQTGRYEDPYRWRHIIS